MATDLDAFCALYLDERDALALRAISGEALTDAERARLANLDALLMPLLPSPDPMSDIVREAIAEARRLTGEA